MASFTWPSMGGGGSGSLASGSVAMANGTNTFTVLYDVTLPLAIPPIFSFANATDANPIFLQGYVSAYSTAGFTVTTNAPTDTSNYVLAYTVMGAV